MYLTKSILVVPRVTPAEAGVILLAVFHAPDGAGHAWNGCILVFPVPLFQNAGVVPYGQV